MTFMIKTSGKPKIVDFLNLIKCIYNELIEKAILNPEIINAFHLRSQRKEPYLLFPILFNIILKELASALRQEKEVKSSKPEIKC